VLTWRIVRPAYADNPLSGEGAAQAGTRWNSVGIRMGYASTSRPLAVLEMLVHMVKNRPPQHAVLVPIEIPDHLIAEVPELPEGWNAYPHRAESREVGDQWIAEGKSLAMFVPSAIIPAERNILINPNHVRFGEIRLGEAEPHALDRRLFGLR